MTGARRSMFWIALAVLVAARIGWGLAAWEPGWSALTWDDFSKVAISQAWAAQPLLIPDLVWLPLPFWVYGSAFRLFGASFADSPMALSAIVNTAAVVAASGLVAVSAWQLFRSRIGTLLAFALALYSPWGFFTSLSGLSEPLYYVAVTAAVAAFIWWLNSDRRSALAAGGLAVAAAAATRYEAWWLAAAWVVVAVGPTLLAVRRKERTLREAAQIGAVASIPLLVPVGWIVVNFARTGNPVYFAVRSAQLYATGYGDDLFDTIPERLLFYPAALARSAPLLLAIVAVVAFVSWKVWKQRNVRMTVTLLTLAFGGFYLATLPVPPVGIFSERYMFVFALALAPLAGGVPRLIESVASPATRRVVTVVGLALVVAVTGLRIADRPIEWTHAPDLLALTDSLGAASAATGPLRVGIGPGMQIDTIPLAVQNGRRISIVMEDTAGAVDLENLPADIDVWIERLPARVSSSDTSAEAVVGRYHLYGPKAHAVSAFVSSCTCGSWTFHGDDGTVHPIGDSGPYVPLEFVADNPPAGSRASVVTVADRGPEPGQGSISLRSLYGHGFNAGRIVVEVQVDDRTVFLRDIAKPSRWFDVPFEVPAGTGPSTIEVAIVAQPGIEPTWAWGRNSTVLIRSMTVAES